MEENKGRKKLPVPGFEPTTLTLEGKVPVCIATITLHKDPWLQLLYKYHKGYILNSIAQYPMHTKERERKSVIELNLKVQKTINIAEYEQLYRVMERILLDITAVITFNCAIILINCAIRRYKINLSLSKYKKLKVAYKEK